MSNLVSLERFKIEKILKKIALATENHSSEVKTGEEALKEWEKNLLLILKDRQIKSLK